VLSRLLDYNSLLENEQAPRYCAIALAVVLVAVLANSIFQSYQTFSHQPLFQKSTTDSPVKREPYKAQTITGQNLFGQIAAGNKQQLDQLNLPQTRLSLVLRGAFTSSDPKRSSAIIEVPGQKTHSFKVNNTVYGNAKLHAVYRDRIVLSRSGQLETLYFPKPSESTKATSASQTAPNISPDVMDLVRERATLSEVTEVAKQLSSKTMSADQRQQLIRQRLQELRNRTRK
jgi:general secretion pathway protein C